MGSGGGGVNTKVATVEKTVTPAVARTVEVDTEKAQAAQADARARRKGISSTYNRFASAENGGNGSASKLG